MPVEQAATPEERGHPTELHIDRLGAVQVALDPYISVLALVTDALGRRRGAPPAWRERVLRSLSPRSAEALLHITAPRYSVLPDCTTPLNPMSETAVGDQVEWLHAISEDQLLGDMHQSFGQAAPPHWRSVLRRPRAWLDAYALAMGEAWRSIEPLWAQAGPQLDREVERVGVAAMRGGVGQVLDQLHPASKFDNGVLTIRDPEPARFALDGRPLVLVPMLSGQQALICNLERPDAVWIGYPLPGLSGRPLAPEDPRRKAEDPLELVTGPVRAQILRATDRPLTMSDLARAAYLVPSALTYHCGRLAAAGLIRREHRGRQVWITRTSRGSELLALLGRER